MNLEKIGITPKNIRKALQKSRPNNWINENEYYSGGLRGVYTIGEKLGDNQEDWSIMNYFDTKNEIHNLLYERFLEENPKIDIVDWLSKILSTDDDFLNKLVERQWQSIENGLKLERDCVNFFLNIIESKEDLDIVFYPHGSKMDRWNGVDVSINGKNFQIKPLRNYNEKENVYRISTYGMKDYKDKFLVNFLVFANNETVMIFRNIGYDVLNKYEVVFNEKPLRIYNQ